MLQKNRKPLQKRCSRETVDMNYKYLLFDADNTLFDFDRCEKEAFLNLNYIEPSVFNSSTFDTYHEINDKLWRKVEKGNISKAKLKTERFRLLFDSLDINTDHIDFQYVAQEYINKLSTQNHLIEGAYDLLEYLYPKYDIYIITNGISVVQNTRLSSSIINRFIKKVFISEEIGFNKPDARYFDFVMRSIGSFETSDYLIIGDSLTSDIKGAWNSKIDCVYFKKSATQRDADTAKYNIESLCELKNIL